MRCVKEKLSQKEVTARFTYLSFESSPRNKRTELVSFRCRSLSFNPFNFSFKKKKKETDDLSLQKTAFYSVLPLPAQRQFLVHLLCMQLLYTV